MNESTPEIDILFHPLYLDNAYGNFYCYATKIKGARTKKLAHTRYRSKSNDAIQRVKELVEGEVLCVGENMVLEDK